MIPLTALVPLLDRLYQAEQALDAADCAVAASSDARPDVALVWLQAASAVALAGEDLDQAVPGSRDASTTADSDSYAGYVAGLLGLSLT